MLKSYFERLSAFQVEKSRVIAIEFESEDPELAAQRRQRGRRRLSRRCSSPPSRMQTRAAGRWLAGEIDKLRTKVAEAEAKVEQYRSKTNLFIGTNNTTLSNQQLGDFNAQLAAARAQKADAEAKARIIRETLRTRRAGRVLRHHQFGADAPAVRAARDVAGAARRAVLDAARPASAHQGIAGADRRSRTADPRRGRAARAFARERRQARGRARRSAQREPRPAQAARRPPPTSRTCSCARSSATPSRSAICWNPISPNIARRPRATASARLRPTRASSRPRSCRTRRPGRRSCRPCWSRRSACSRCRSASS